ncbi:hypothetical protein IWQ60_001997 [Tieghemiomyces parasiticus]|uniref:Phospholipid scramblase n=1 Tax=Tieghemiomyces parasiticus TaxID=78921 RepID=A0A9W8AFX3_9FUNG|nr:hypothetical protein IWQ60_001997 [Tieghemiomyces parasiticus]
MRPLTRLRGPTTLLLGTPWALSLYHRIRPIPIFAAAYSTRGRTTQGGYRGGLSRLNTPITRRSAPAAPSEAPVRSPTPASTAALVPVDIPKDRHGILQPDAPSTAVLANSALVMTRQIELMNVLVGFEQANKYAIVDASGNHVGYIAESESLGNTITRQLFRTHRAFKASILDKEGNLVLEIHRPFSWINSRIYIKTPTGEIIGEVHQEWHLWKRRYDLFVRGDQFARIDGGFLTWDFDMVDADGARVSSINRNFSGFAREIFTDTGQYVLRLDAASTDQVEGGRGLTLDERAVALACAVTIDIDYFSRHSGHGGGGFMPFPMFFPGMGGGGGEAAEQGTEAGGAPDTTSSPGATGAPPPHPGGYGVESPPDDPFLDDPADGDDGGFFDGDDW